MSASAVTGESACEVGQVQRPDEETPPTRSPLSLTNELVSEDFEDGCELDGVDDDRVIATTDASTARTTQLQSFVAYEPQESFPTLTDRLACPARGPPCA